MPDPVLLLDTSALLALSFQEPGRDVVAAALDGAAISAVNQVEVVEIAARRGMNPVRATAWAKDLSLPILPFTDAMGAQAGEYLSAFRRRGVSLGDAACLGTARVMSLPVLTADRAWASLGLPIEVRLVR